MREKVPSPNAPQSLEELRSSSSPRRGKRSCSRRTSHRRASWLPMKEPREPLPSQRRGTRERGAVSVVAFSGNPRKSKFWGKLDETNALLVKERENVEKVTIEATPVIQEKEIIVEDTAKIDALIVEVERLKVGISSGAAAAVAVKRPENAGKLIAINYCEKYAKAEDVGTAPEEKSSDDEEISEDQYDSSDEQRYLSLLARFKSVAISLAIGTL
ncbi:hypothetical protein Ahy_B01g054393 [Arachis hypogaea]|uniref:Uncharacterized protein n=1 Tax=Arachis hypogaea TaxID=3818 RepID=A0A445ATV1_ARAHY|nr:hypothetical protein Ahy_B01g054393 [Arachis hypogaea]